MEQKINSSNLDNAEKLELQQYITRCYEVSSTFLTGLRVMNDYFVGEKTK
jgi:hypothetical protein